MTNQSTKFIATILDISISTVTKVIQKIYNCEKNGLGLEKICKKSGPKSAQLDSPGNIALTQIVQEDPTLTQQGMR